MGEILYGSRSGTRSVAVVAALVLLASGCGSAEKLRGTSSDLQSKTQSSDAGNGPKNGVVGKSEAPSGSTASSGTRLAGSAPSLFSSAPQRPPQAGEIRGPGVLRDRIKIGYLVPDRDWDGVFAALGTPSSGGIGFGDQRKQVEAVVNDMNAHGGIAGRKIEPYYFTYSFNRTLSPDSAAVQAQEACSYWTQDNRVFAVSQTGFESWRILNCLVAKKVVHVNTSTFVSAAHYQKIADYYYNASFNSLDRLAVDYVHGLAAQGFFGKPTTWGPKSRIGLIQSPPSAETSDFEDAVKHGLEPELKRRGLKIHTRALVGTASNYTNVAVQFRNEGITHVIYAVTSPLNISQFMQAAQSQQYFPWHGVSSSAGPGVLLQHTAPAEQLVKSMGPGWAPLGDVAPSENPYSLSSADRRCLDVMRRAGQETTNVLTRALQIGTCQLNWFFREGMEKARPNLTVRGLAAAVAAHGSGFYAIRESPMPYRFGPNRVSNGVAAFRPLRFDTGCECYKYTGKVQPMP